MTRRSFDQYSTKCTSSALRRSPTQQRKPDAPLPNGSICDRAAVSAGADRLLPSI